MAVSQSKTKRRIAAAFRELVDEMPVQKISIQMIADRCDLSKRTFYNHFIDKEDVAKWIFLSHFEDSDLNFDDFHSYLARSVKVLEDDWDYYEKIQRDGTCWTWHIPWLEERLFEYIKSQEPDESLYPQIKNSISVWSSGAEVYFQYLLRRGEISHDIIGSYAHEMISNMPELLQRYLTDGSEAAPAPTPPSFSRQNPGSVIDDAGSGKNHRISLRCAEARILIACRAADPLASQPSHS